MDGVSTLSRYLTYGVIAVVILCVAAFALNQAGGPVTDTRGIVESHTHVPTDTGPPVQRAVVRLADGAVVQAIVVMPTPIRTGETAKVRVYRRVITGAPKYEVIGVEASK